MASGLITSRQIDGETVETVADLIFGAPKSLQMVIAAMRLKDTYSLEGKLCPLCQQRSIWSKLQFFQWSCMDVRVGLSKNLSSEELMLLNCGVGEDS